MDEMFESFDYGDLDSLDIIFTLPEYMYVDDMKYRIMYEKIVHRLLEEAKGVPVQTVPWTLLERIANLYVVIRYKESIPPGNPGGYTKPNEAKDLNTLYLSLVQEWNRFIKGSDIEERKLARKELLSIVSKTLRLLDISVEDKTKLVNKLGLDLEKAGWSA